MADDLGVGEIGPFPGGSREGVKLQTPHLDELAASGLSFSQAYAGYTVCAPSRTTLFTGLHSGQFPTHNLDGTSLAPGQLAWDNLAEMLQKQGYRTGAFGKTAPLDAPE